MSKNILVLGGSGRTGGLVVQQALAAGHTITALVRNPDAITVKHENLNVIKGTPESADDVTAAMQGADSLIVTLNNSRAADSPFAKIVNRPTLLTECIENTLVAMNDQGIRRIAMLGAAGVGDSFATSPWFMRLLIKHSNLGHAYRDHEGVEAVLAKSGLDWTVGRAMMLGKKLGAEPVIESYVVNNTLAPKPAMQISRASVAKWLIDSLDRPDLIAKTPIISQK